MADLAEGGPVGVKAVLQELEIVVSICSSFEDVLEAERILAGIAGRHVRLRSFQAGVAVLSVRVPAALVPLVRTELRGPCGSRFQVSETRTGRIELWTRDGVPAAALPRPLPIQGLTPG